MFRFDLDDCTSDETPVGFPGSAGTGKSSTTERSTFHTKYPPTATATKPQRFATTPHHLRSVPLARFQNVRLCATVQSTATRKEKRSFYAPVTTVKSDVSRPLDLSTCLYSHFPVHLVRHFSRPFPWKCHFGETPAKGARGC